MPHSFPPEISCILSHSLSTLATMISSWPPSGHHQQQQHRGHHGYDHLPQKAQASRAASLNSSAACWLIFARAFPFTSPFTTWVTLMLCYDHQINKKKLRIKVSSAPCQSQPEQWAKVSAPSWEASLAPEPDHVRCTSIPRLQDSRGAIFWDTQLIFTCSHFFVQEGRWMPMLRDPKSRPQM